MSKTRSIARVVALTITARSLADTSTEASNDVASEASTSFHTGVAHVLSNKSVNASSCE